MLLLQQQKPKYLNVGLTARMRSNDIGNVAIIVKLFFGRTESKLNLLGLAPSLAGKATSCGTVIPSKRRFQIQQLHFQSRHPQQPGHGQVEAQSWKVNLDLHVDDRDPLIPAFPILHLEKQIPP